MPHEWSRTLTQQRLRHLHQTLQSVENKLAILVEIHLSRRHFIRVGKIVIVRSRICRSEGMTSALGSPFGQSGTESIDCPCPPIASRLAFPFLATQGWASSYKSLAPGSASTSNCRFDDFETSLVYRRHRCERRGGRESDNPGHELSTPAAPSPARKRCTWALRC
jgi:hypothetical protein